MLYILYSLYEPKIPKENDYNYTFFYEIAKKDSDKNMQLSDPIFFDWIFWIIIVIIGGKLVKKYFFLKSLRKNNIQ